MKPCFTDDTPPRATCKKTFNICINNLVFAEQKLIIASREKKEACKTVNVTGLTSVMTQNYPSLISKLEVTKMCIKESQNPYIFLYLKCNRRYVSFCFHSWSYGVLLYEIFTIGKVL